MKPSYPSLLLSLSTVGSTSPVGPRAACASGLHIIAARASGEAAGPGMIGAVAQDIIARVPGSDLESVVYPASINNVQDYANSEHQGTLALTQLIQTYLAACPSAKIALLGYSQGAEVVGDVLCGTSSDISPKTAPLATQYGNAVVAAISMGSPAHVANQPYNKGTSTRNGIWFRRDTASCQPYAARLVEYCDTNDYYCDSAALALDPTQQVHRGYVTRYGADATNFVVGKAGAAGLKTTTAAGTTATKKSGLLGLGILGL